jgi:phage shock protein A
MNAADEHIRNLQRTVHSQTAGLDREKEKVEKLTVDLEAANEPARMGLLDNNVDAVYPLEEDVQAKKDEIHNNMLEYQQAVNYNTKLESDLNAARATEPQLRDEIEVLGIRIQEFEKMLKDAGYTGAEDHVNSDQGQMSHSAATESATSALSQTNDNSTSGDLFRSLQLLKQIAADTSLQGPYRITMLHVIEAFKSHHKISFHAPRRHP